MRTDNTSYEEPISTDNTPLYVEQYERDHIDWQYKSTKEPFLCSGEESGYLDSEFSNELENADQGNLDEDYDDALDEGPNEDEDDDPYEDFEEEEDETDEQDLDDEDLNDEDLE